MAEFAQAVYAGTLGTQPWLGGGDDEEEEPPSEDAVRGSVWFNRIIRRWLGLEPEDEEEELRYSLDPNAKPDPRFFQKIGAEVDQQGRPLMAIQQVKAEDLKGPFADRLREVMAQRAAADERNREVQPVDNP